MENLPEITGLEQESDVVKVRDAYDALTEDLKAQVYNLNLLEAVVQNTEMGKNTLEQIVPMTEDPAFRAELLRERNLYRELNQEAHTAIEACGGTAQGQSIMAKLNTKMGIGMKTLTDRSTRNLAEMLSEGSSQGVMDCIKSQKDYPDAAPGSKRLMQKLQDLEEENRLKLEEFL